MKIRINNFKGKNIIVKHNTPDTPPIVDPVDPIDPIDPVEPPVEPTEPQPKEFLNYDGTTLTGLKQDSELNNYDETLKVWCLKDENLDLVDEYATEIGDNVFINHKTVSPTSVSFPNVTKVGVSSFAECYKLTSVNLPKVQEVGTYSFKGSSNISSFTFGEQLTKIGNSAFSGCSSVGSFDLPYVTDVGGSSFNGCKILTQLNLPNATNVLNNAFSWCVALPSISLPNATMVGNQAFSNCNTKLTSVSMPKAKFVGSGAFQSSTKITNIDVSSLTISEVLSSINYWVLSANCTIICKDGSVTISGGVASTTYTANPEQKRTKVSICCIGDSITFGSNGKETTPTYMTYLNEMLANEGFEVTWMGESRQQYSSQLPSVAQAGLTAPQLLTKYNNAITKSLSLVAPSDIVIIHSGHNYKQQAGATEQQVQDTIITPILTAHQNLINSIRSVSGQEHSLVIASKVITAETKNAQYNYIPALNEQIETTCLDMNSDDTPVAIVDMADGWNPNDMQDCQYDGIHPTEQGAEKMAQKLCNLICSKREWIEALDKNK